MDLIDKYLLPRIEREITDEQTGAWVASLRPRRFGQPVADTSMITFRRPGQKPGQGFGVRMWVLRLTAGGESESDWVVTASLTLTTGMARQAMAWVKEINEEEQCP